MKNYNKRGEIMISEEGIRTVQENLQKIRKY